MNLYKVFQLNLLRIFIELLNLLESLNYDEESVERKASRKEREGRARKGAKTTEGHGKHYGTSQLELHPYSRGKRENVPQTRNFVCEKEGRKENIDASRERRHSQKNSTY